MASSNLLPGLKGQRQTIVCEHNVAGHVNKFSTPAMIAVMEQAALHAVQPSLGPHQTTVGYEVNVRHLASAGIGAIITAHAELLSVERNRLTFQVEAFSNEEGSGGDRKIGEGTHRRAIEINATTVTLGG